MVWNFVLVAVGGALGSVARYGLNIGAKAWFPSTFPWGTLAANVLGCFLIGLFSEWAGSKVGMGAETRLFLTTGFCGGFTTLSSLVLETNTSFRTGEWFVGGLYLVTSLVVPFLALWAGIAVVRLVAKS